MSEADDPVRPAQRQPPPASSTGHDTKLFDHALEQALGSSEIHAQLAAIQLSTDEMRQRLRRDSQAVWGAVATERGELAAAEQRLQTAKQQLQRQRTSALGVYLLAWLLLLVGGVALWAALNLDALSSRVCSSPVPTASTRSPTSTHTSPPTTIAANSTCARLAGPAGRAALGITGSGVVGVGLIVAAVRRRRVGRLQAALDIGSLEARLKAARKALELALVDKAALPEIRRLINQELGPSYSTTLRVHRAPGLQDPVNQDYEVPTKARQQLERLLARLTGGSIGITGPRGAGKTTLVRSLCPDAGRLVVTERAAHLSVIVSVPVHYQPREFVLYLFRMLCSAVLDEGAVSVRPARAAQQTGAPRPIASQPTSPGMGWHQPHEQPGLTLGRFPSASGPLRAVVPPADLAGRLRRLREQARTTLAEMEWQQTYSSGWSGMLRMPILQWSLEGKRERRVDLARRQRTYPEIVHELRAFVGQIASLPVPTRVVIGIDELDKIDSTAQARRFLNDIKGLFGLDRCVYLVSLSEDAMSSFERRGMPFRDVFDSSFDEIVRIPYLDLAESIRLLQRRVIGLSVPFLCLCHCLSGGLARDLIRAARNLLDAGAQAADSSLASMCATLVRRDLCAKSEAITIAARAAAFELDMSALLLWIDGLRRQVEPGQLLDLCAAFDPCCSRLAEHSADPRSVTLRRQVVTLGREMAVYGYYCATLLEFFDHDLDEEQLTIAQDPALASGSIEQLASAHQALAVDPGVAWATIGQFRSAWRLRTVGPPLGPATTGPGRALPSPRASSRTANTHRKTG